MKAPAFKPLSDVIRIKKREDVSGAAPEGSEIYKAFLNACKKNEDELINKNVKIVIYEHVKYEEEENLGNGSSESDSDWDHGCALQKEENKIDKKGRKKKKETQWGKNGETTKGESTNSNSVKNEKEKRGPKDKGNPKETAKEIGKGKSTPGGANQNGKELKYTEKEENTHKVGEKCQGDGKNEEETHTERSTTHPNGKNTLIVHTEESDVVKERKSSKVLGTVKILYNFYVNLFDKLKEDVENIQNGAANEKIDLFRDVNLYANCISMFDIINLCEDLKIIKTFLNSKKECELIWILTVNYLDKVDVNLFERYKHKIDVTFVKDIPGGVNGTQGTHTPGQAILPGATQPGKGREQMKSNKSDVHTEEVIEKKKEKTQKGDDITPIGGKEEDNVREADASEREENPPRACQEVHNLKEYIYAKCHERKNAIMFRKVNFFVFLYVLIYIIKTSSRKIKSLSDDIKKLRSFFFFLNLYEKKKTIETLKNIYKDKYLTFFQNFKSRKEIEEYRRRKIFCHKFSFYNVNKILNQKGEDLVKLKEACTRGEKHPPTGEEQSGESNVDEGIYNLTNFVDTTELESDLNCTSNPQDESKKGSPPLLSPYLLDYIFKNYCYKKKHWKIKENAWINFGVVRKEENKKYKMEIYNHTKFNISVDVLIDEDLPILAIFKDKLFCVSSKYSIYLQIDGKKEGEWFGFVNISLRYKNSPKGDDTVRIPVYVHVSP
ncbi:conserved Plasmodium protein, unknown function [Plasmodium knowlesi strain H]|uniref:Uncharacterized protein n=3 Tax=Plasmodium knowlesi TaxID=5850 RepID=A0A5K1VIS3_PLAKH|nr:conserved Plasmodium protein, unknown function [Plasmodium knowlesi strain H]OTN68030.1 Uncharacterized protein PKNOH_S04363000 [Plasmodium knowlesi]CAA9986990.1 conserved Plasmodium protein, unknown function [Plasmodium knowlesi strain H]SBO26638.1 conserved Plasmodium protein, unknown function [Plasmodium knowlesi strain H]SBO28196.1 conserved Plasmodium protein, unknown function [Plasmodium knowlesi strain H]VVS76464.1 conserved Plasmodium protein, unknown function [Plasmodium knowlesi s|eukprot:XP_002258235.1 hypothetical protein, conserved in Plasmodium species [Plasmodium knowlesi strain H]